MIRRCFSSLIRQKHRELHFSQNHWDDNRFNNILLSSRVAKQKNADIKEHRSTFRDEKLLTTKKLIELSK